MNRSLSLLLASLAFCAGVLLAGCGSGSAFQAAKNSASAAAANAHSTTNAVSRKGSGKATITIKWPARSRGVRMGKSAHSRLIPSAANSIQVALSNGSAPVASTLLTRPDVGGDVVSTYTFMNLAPGSLTATASAFPNPDGTGTAQASASSALTITDGQTAPLTLTMDSTVASIAIGGTPSVKVHHGTAMTATALDSQGNVVLVGGTITLTSSNSDLATVDPVTGIVTGLHAGIITLTATYAEAGTVVMTGTQSVTINPNTPDAIYYSNGTSIKRITGLSDTNPQTLTYEGMRVSQMVVDSKGAIYVADSNTPRVLKFSGMTDTNPQSLTYDGMYPRGIALHNGNIYVADMGNRRIFQFSDMTDTNPQILSYNSMYPQTLAVDSANAIYVLDTNNRQILKFANMTDTNPQATTFTFSDPNCMGLDSNDNLYVAEHSGAKIYKFANIQDTSPQSITLPGMTFGAHGIALFDTGLYVANTHGNDLLSYSDFSASAPGTYLDNGYSFQTIAVQ